MDRDNLMAFFQRYRFNWSLIALMVAVLGALLLYGTYGIRIDTDILGSLPRHDPVLADAYRVVRHLPGQDRLVVDLEVRGAGHDARDLLVAAAETIEAGLRSSGLFKDVGIGRMEALFPELLSHVAASLPLLFEAEQLEREVAPRLRPEALGRTLAENLKVLQGFEGIGQAELLARDPLGLRNLVLARMSQILPSQEAQFYRGKLLSRDGNHLLVLAELKGAGTDTAYSRSIPPLLDALEGRINAGSDGPQGKGVRFVLTPTGAYRAALDNENAAKRDMRWAIVLTTLGIAALLLVTFPRPLVGLLALLPSTAGAIFALLVCSFVFPSLSILAVSFGGAIMAFTVDLGIAYLLFLDRPAEVLGAQAAREVQSAELLSAATTIGAFLLLLASRFTVLAQVGLFAALGVAFAFAFVHWVFPRLFPAMPPALKVRGRLLGRILDGIALSGGRIRAAAILAFFAFMLFFARPVFLVDIYAMNSMTDETIAADKTLQRIWGEMTSRVYVMTEGRTVGELQAKSDRLSGMFREDLKGGVVKGAFTLSDLFPGEEAAKRRASTWREFWTPERRAALKREFRSTGGDLGFAPDAFAPFLASLDAPAPAAAAIPDRFNSLLGISREGEKVLQVSLVAPGPAYEAASFFSRYDAADLVSLFDAGLFNRRLGEVLVTLFSEIAVITAGGIILVVFLFFLDWRRSLIVLAPVAFALVCTLGTLNLLGRPIDIPGIMLWIVIMGMGIDYGIYYVCSYQRYPDERHPGMTLIRQAMFLAGATTLIGFGVLALSRHTVLRSIGLTSLLGIGYSLIGAFLIVPPLIRRALVPAVLPPETLVAGSARHQERVRLRFRHLPAIPRLFARWKMRLDPMFGRLALFMDHPRRILDIGCGYGVPSVWLLELFPEATLCGIDPDAERIRVASQVLGARGEMRVGRAPELEGLPGGADRAMILDVIHMIDDKALQRTLAILHEKLVPGGRLVLRATIPRQGPRSWMGRVELFRLKRQGLAPHYRSCEAIGEMVAAAGFVVRTVEPPDPGTEEVWFVADRPAEGEDGRQADAPTLPAPGNDNASGEGPALFEGQPGDPGRRGGDAGKRPPRGGPA